MFATLICVYFEVDIKSFVLAIDFVHKENLYFFNFFELLKKITDNYFRIQKNLHFQQYPRRLWVEILITFLITLSCSWLEKPETWVVTLKPNFRIKFQLWFSWKLALTFEISRFRKESDMCKTEQLNYHFVINNIRVYFGLDEVLDSLKDHN